MKFTSEDLMKAMGLKVGDRVKVKTILKDDEDIIYTIDNTGGCLLGKDDGYYNLFVLMDREYEILPRPKRVGDLKCDDFKLCDEGCPLEWLCWNCNIVHENSKNTLYDVLKLHEIDDKEVYDLFKARLDKEVL